MPKITVTVDNMVRRTVRIGDNPPVIVGPNESRDFNFDATTGGAFVVEIGAETPGDPKDSQVDTQQQE